MMPQSSPWSLVLILILAVAIPTAALCGASRAVGQEPSTFSIAEKSDSEMVTRQAVCRWAAKPPVIDGKLDDLCWKQATVIDRFATFWTRTPREGTRAYLVWDAEAIYYAGTMTDTEVRAFGTHRNDTLWEGDVFELFLKPSADHPEYFEFQANPRGLVFEMAFAKRGEHPDPFSKGPVLGTRAVAVVDGTLDQPGDKDRSWTVEGRIPWSAFSLTGAKPMPGDSWLFAICRYDYGPEGTQSVQMSSAPLTQSSFHRYEDYGTLRFEGPSAQRRRAHP